MKDKIIIYTDGAAKGNPGKAGWGAVVLLSQNSSDPNGVYEMGGHVAHATNNQMELTAPIEALKYVKNLSPNPSPYQGEGRRGEVEIISDSKYVILGITEWISNWQKNNWRNANKKPVLNRELWEELYALTQELKPRWTYVKGHNEDKYNDRANLIATSFAEGAPVKLVNLAG
ncbi:MAG: ribonuclease H [Patescibacteria group bacterium]